MHFILRRPVIDSPQSTELQLLQGFPAMRSEPARLFQTVPFSKVSTGFTLIEILVVVVVIAILASLVAPNVFQHVGTARVTTAKAQIEMIGAALDSYRLDVGRYPSAEEGLQSLWSRPSSAPANWRGPYLRKPVPADPWGNAYEYRAPAALSSAGYELRSLGADGRAGGEGDDADINS